MSVYDEYRQLIYKRLDQTHMEKGKKKDNKIYRMMSGPVMPYIIALLGAYGMNGIQALGSAEDIRYSNSIFSFIVFGMGVSVLLRVWNVYCSAERRYRIPAWIFSLVLSMALYFGACLESVENVRFERVTLWAGMLSLSVFMAPIVYSLSDWTLLFSRKLTENEDAGAEKKPLKLIQIWAIIFLLWMPVFLALYPGAFVYDAQEEYIEVISRTFDMHHPLLHVLTLGGMVHGAEYVGLTANTGIAAYVIVQMAVMSFVLAYTIKRMEALGMKKSYLTAVMVFFGLFPIFPMYAVCTAKDGLFTAFLLLMTVELTVYVKRAEDFNPTVFAFAAVFMMLYRNNGVYAFAVSMIIILIMECIRTSGRTGSKTDSDRISDAEKRSSQGRDRDRVRKMIILTLLSLVLYAGVNYVLKTAVRAADSEHQEILTVPIQQLGRTYTYAKDVFTDEEADILHEYLPEEYLITYRFRISDILKSGFNNAAYERDSASFFRLWSSIGMRKPLIYLNAWFGTSYGYWYPDALNNVYEGNQMYTFRYTDSSYFGFETEPPGERDSKFPVLERLYEHISLHLFQQKLPVVSQLFSPGFMWWVLAFVLYCLLIRSEDRSKKIIPLLPVLMVWLTVLLGPTTLVRYVIILWFVIPIYPVLLAESDISSVDSHIGGKIE